MRVEVKRGEAEGGESRRAGKRTEGRRSSECEIEERGKGMREVDL
jgi:hypothetical protein